MKLLGHGILSWDGAERRSDRYGSFALISGSAFDSKSSVVVSLNKELLKSLIGKRVRVVCTATETRKSGHVGDLFHGIMPSTPEVGEEICLGVGIMGSEIGWDGSPTIMLVPDDGRTRFWIDPRLLYRLHEQTVSVHVEETDDAFSLAPDINADDKPGTIDSGLGDGTFQTKNVADVKDIVIPRDITPLGDGMFALDQQNPGQFGRYRIELRR